MTEYERLEDLAEQHGIFIDYSPLHKNDYFDGLYLNLGAPYPTVILINKYLSESERLAILAEELGHHFASYGNVVAQQDVFQRKQEALGRAWAYEHLMPPGEVFSACIDGEGSPWELSERLGLPERFILEALEYYARKFGGIDIERVRIHACRLPA